MKSTENPESKWNVATLEAISFDCYGTLIDWDEGMKNRLREEGVLEQLPVPWADFSARRLRREMELQQGPYRTYREILAHSLVQSLRELRVEAEDRLAIAFAESVKEWKPFPDVLHSLRRIGSKWPMMILSNVDRSVLLQTVHRLGVPFSELITAEDVRSYKPGAAHFEEAKKRLVKKDGRLLHVSASVVHDIEPATRLGIQCVYVDRVKNESSRELPAAGALATKVVGDLKELCALLGA